MHCTSCINRGCRSTKIDVGRACLYCGLVVCLGCYDYELRACTECSTREREARGLSLKPETGSRKELGK
jgi:hypothetical protein